jgi:peptide-methionine (R)-S-oxide reductase
MITKLTLSDEEWQKRLTAEEYEVLRRHGTERPWTGCFVGSHDLGTYVCAGCGQPLFRSGEKFESGTGWPSFSRPITADAVVEVEDRSHGMRRVEGPPPSRLRYCMNSVSMKHVKEGEPMPLVEA